jgi:hypothetical protein
MKFLLVVHYTVIDKRYNFPVKLHINSLQVIMHGHEAPVFSIDAGQIEIFCYK